MKMCPEAHRKLCVFSRSSGLVLIFNICGDFVEHSYHE